MTTSEPSPNATASGCTSPAGDALDDARTTSCQSESASIEKPSSFGICEMITMSGDRVEVAHPDRLGQQVGDEAEPQDPAERAAARPTMIASRPASATARLVVAERERQDRCRDDRRERRVGPEHEDARRAEHRIREQGHDRGVEAGLRRAARRPPRSPFPRGSAAPSRRCRRGRRATARRARSARATRDARQPAADPLGRHLASSAPHHRGSRRTVEGGATRMARRPGARHPLSACRDRRP